MLWFKFLRAKLPQIIVFLFILGIYIVSFLLWHLPIWTLLNSSLFALIIYIIYIISSYFHWKSLQEKMENLIEKNKELHEQIEKKELADKEFTDIIRVWSHQMKVPLSAIDLMVQTQVNTEELQAQVFSLENYLKILLEYQRITNLSTDFRFEKFSVMALSKELIKKYSTFFIQKQLSVNFDMTEDWMVTSDKRWFSLGLEQLINNAVKYTKTGSVTLHISPEEIIIQDTGIGILAEDLPRLFEHGFTGYNGRIQQKSTGLGLYLTKMIFDKLEFSIDIDSQVGSGTSVTVKKMIE
ncbi:sensor histidine kinase [Lactococcus nasutitermitis]|uniref:histidine kinase n=1 Tax=Lactococcus nasutitermitis TaxID=1652957 RepID=A0ABV9JBA5_9LACT|nr:HAMP domain-containing sensor histidine kinase [Lactococcus nasutitermitis]